MADDLKGIDFESAYDLKSGHGFGKQTTLEYCADPRTDVLMLAYCEANDHGVLRSQQNIIEYLYSLKDDIVVAHNGFFDFLLWAVRYPQIPMPKFLMCTRKQALTLGFDKTSLAALAPLVGMEKKQFNMEGADPDDPEFLAYASTDARICFALARSFLPMFKDDMYELHVHDLVMRMAIQPQLMLDQKMLSEAITEEYEARLEIKRAGYTPTQLRSAEQFANILRLHGVVPPTKISKSTGKTIYAFAKSDNSFLALREHEDPKVQFLVDAKLQVQSSITISRAMRMLQIHKDYHGYFPVPLETWLTKTGRLSGTDKVNPQNFQRKSKIRHAIIAPDGYVILVSDLKQIEARMLAWLSNDIQYLQVFRSGADPYCEEASRTFGRTITKADETERFIGKVQVLGLGYGMGPMRLACTLLVGFQGQTATLNLPQKDLIVPRSVPEKPLEAFALTDEEWDLHYRSCHFLVHSWRNAHPAITQFWSLCGSVLADLANNVNADYGPFHLKHKFVTLPDGQIGMNFTDLVYDQEKGSYVKGNTHYYPGIMVENIDQWLSGRLFAMKMVEINQKLGIRPAMQVHDELVMVLPESEAEHLKTEVERILREPLPQFKGLPVDVESSVAKSYGDAK